MITNAPSVKKRFFISLLVNIFRGAISFTTGVLLARWLGPEEFGNMAFLLSSFLAFRQLLDMARSSAFFLFSPKASAVKNLLTILAVDRVSVTVFTNYSCFYSSRIDS